MTESDIKPYLKGDRNNFHYIAVEGASRSGKTRVAKRIAGYFNCKEALDDPGSNHYAKNKSGGQLVQPLATSLAYLKKRIEILEEVRKDILKNVRPDGSVTNPGFIRSTGMMSMEGSHINYDSGDGGEEEEFLMDPEAKAEYKEYVAKYQRLHELMRAVGIYRPYMMKSAMESGKEGGGSDKGMEQLAEIAELKNSLNHFFQPVAVSNFIIDRDLIYVKEIFEKDEDIALYEYVRSKMGTENLVKPNLVIFLQNSKAEMEKRYKTGKSNSFLNFLDPKEHRLAINEAYNTYFQNWDRSAIITVNQDVLDVANVDEDFILLIDTIKRMDGKSRWYLSSHD